MIQKFCEDNGITRQSSNKKDRTDLNGEEKVSGPMKMINKEAYLLFKTEYPDIRIASSNFYTLKPEWIKTERLILNCLVHIKKISMLLGVIYTTLTYYHNLSHFKLIMKQNK